MSIIVAAVAVVGALCLLDLLLTFGVIRRLREHTAMLTAVGGNADRAVGMPAGESPAPFTAVTTSGEHVTGPANLRVAAFFSSWCSACPERVPPFVDYLASHGIGREDVLAVVAGDDSTPVPYLDGLAEVAQVCVEPTEGEMATAFKVTGYPAFFLLDAGGAVLATEWDPAALPEPALV